MSALSLGGCAQSPFQAPHDPDIITGSIPSALMQRQPQPLPAVLTQVAQQTGNLPAPLAVADEKTVQATLARALLDEEHAATVPWLDETSGHGGVISPVGQRIRNGDGLCRAVVISIQRGSATHWVQANACRDNSDEWTLRDVQPWSNPG